MSRIEACRICLITGVKLARIQGSLENKIKFVFGHNVLYSSELPDYVCYECAALTAKYNKFKKKYLTAQSLLFNILQNDGMVTEKEIKAIDRNATKLSSNLTLVHIENESPLIEIKVENDPIGDDLELTIEEDTRSSDEDDVSLYSMKRAEQVNNNKVVMKGKQTLNKKRPTSLIVLGESSTKKKKLQKNDESLFEDLIASGMNMNYENTEIENHSNADISIHILENQNIMMNNQQEILTKLSELTGRFQDATITNNTSIITCNTPVRDNHTPIDSLKELDDFENVLNDPEKKRALHDTYSIFFKGKGQGANCAYTLIDALFSRRFLTTCSWAGGSRGEESKTPFRAYKNTIRFLYELCQECDNSFSLIDCCNFIKTVLRNSAKRLQSKGLRISTIKRRRKFKKTVDNFEINAEDPNADEQATSFEET